MREVVVTGIGVAAPGALRLPELERLFQDGRCAIRRLADVPGEWHGGVVDDAPLAAGFSRAELSTLDRNTLMALHASREAIANSGLASPALRDCGVYVGSGGGGTHAIEETYRSLIATDEVRSTALVKAMANAAAAQLSIRWGMTGPNLTYSVACSSSAIAIGEAWRSIRQGEIDMALAGGTETPLTEGVVRSWAAMRILARAQAGESEPHCRPFSANRNGLLLGEGAAFFVLEDEAAARARCAVIHARLSGYAASADASHITAPSPEGQARTIRRALANAGIATGEIGYVNAHGTGTSNGDVSEAKALHLVFGDAASRIPVSATKSAHGHLIGAAGALELIPAILAVRDGLIAPTIHFDAPDPDCHLDCVPNHAREDRRIQHALSNSFAFGGSNAALVVSRFG